MSLLWILLIAVVALALFGGLGARGGWGRGDAVDGGGGRAGFGIGGGVISLIVVVLLVVLLVGLLA